MKKSDLINKLADSSGLLIKDVRQVLNDLGQAAHDELNETGEFILPGVVKLYLAQRAARRGRNPTTGEPIDIPAKRVVKAKVLSPINKIGG